MTHEAKGNMTSDPSVSMTYGYSSENLLTNANGPYGAGTLTYDPIMRLFDSGSGGRTRVLHDGTQRIAEYSQAGGQRNRFVFGPGIDEPLIEYTGSELATRQFLHADERGSIIGTSDSSGNSTGVGTFDDYGRHLTFAGFRFGYAGQPYETVSELQYSRARFYNPRLARFQQPDPIEYDDGPNLYVAFRGDPLNLIDPSGTEILLATHNVPFGIARHAKIIIVPQNQAAYASHPLFQQRLDDGRRYATLGAGPSWSGWLVGEPNRPNDVDMSANRSEVSLRLPRGVSEDQMITRLFDADAVYQDNLDYDLFPKGLFGSGSSGYNSNSYAHGILIAVGFGELPGLRPRIHPGWSKPVPESYFGYYNSAETRIKR